jgi:hypothetical protein
MRKLELQMRRQKDTAILAKASGDDTLRRECQSNISKLTSQYKAVAEATGLKTRFEKTYVHGFEPVSDKINIPEEVKKPNERTAPLHKVAELDKEKYKNVSEDIVTEEVIITEERIQHIKERHPNDYERFNGYLAEIIQNPDYILEDSRPATAMVLKEIKQSGERFRLALRLATSTDKPGYKNSVITFLKIKDKEWRRLIKNKKILYKAE